MTKHVLIVAVFTVNAVRLTACASSEVEAPDDAGPSVNPPPAEAELPLDAGPSSDVIDASAPDDASSACTEGGWCRTAVPRGSDGGVLSLADVWDHGGGDVWTIAEEGLVLHWDKSEWVVAFDAGVSLTQLWGTEGGGLWIAGKSGTLLYHAPGTAPSSWEVVSIGTTDDLLSVCEGMAQSPASRNVWVATSIGTTSTVFHWDGATGSDGKPTWVSSAITFAQARTMRCVDHRVWLGGRSLVPSESLIRVNDGTGWKSPIVPPTSDQDRVVHSLWIAGESDLWLSSERALFHRTAGDAGVPVWASYPIDRASLAPPMKFWASSASDLWVAGRHGRIYHWDGNEMQLSRTSSNGVILDNRLRGISGSADDVWVVGDNVALHRKRSE
jgi:hypothetical protein